MRYLIQTCLSASVQGRKEYLYDVCKLWFYESKSNDAYLELKSIPLTEFSNTVFVVGHNVFVKQLLLDTTFNENSIVAITCDGVCNFKQLKLTGKHKLYLPYLNSFRLAALLKGSSYGFAFDLTESEINLYNAPKEWNFQKRIDKCFQRVQ